MQSLCIVCLSRVFGLCNEVIQAIVDHEQVRVELALARD